MRKRFIMTPKEFAHEFSLLRKSLLDDYFNNNKSLNGGLLATMNLTSENKEIAYKVVENAITDALYTALLGLDGCAIIGHEQVVYKLFDNNNNLLAGDGRLEAHAYEELQNK